MAGRGWATGPEAIRHLEDAHEVKEGVSRVALRLYRLVVDRYLPHELPALRQKYLDDWRTSNLERTRVHYHYAGPLADG